MERSHRGCDRLRMHLGWQLDELRKSGLAIPEPLRSEISELLSQIDEICKGAAHG